MVVCKFFQQGSCRYGQNCRFEHIYGSQYTYNANSRAPVQQTPAANVGTDEQLVNQVKCDIQAMLKGGQWVLSCYAPFKEKPCYPGLSDLSPEEARLLIYEAKANNTLDQAVFSMDNLYKETRNKYEQLLHPNLNTIKVFRSLFRGETLPQPQSNFGTNNASSIFRSALNTAPAPHNNAASVFSQNSNRSIFGQQSTDAKSIFAQATKETFVQPSVFSTNTETPKSLFAQEAQKVFGVTQPANTMNIFASAAQSVFQNANDSLGNTSTGIPTNIFQNSGQTFNSNNSIGNIFQQSSSENDNVYSKLEELSKEDIEAFESSDFKLGFVPESPPPLSLCS